MQLVIFILCLCIFNVINAYYDAHRINKGKKIAHWLNGILYVAIFTIMMYFSEYTIWYMILFGVQAFVNRQVTFDIPLNKWRGLDWDYISPNPSSIIDKIEIALFGKDGTVINAAYIILWVLSIIGLILF